MECGEDFELREVAVLIKDLAKNNLKLIAFICLPITEWYPANNDSVGSVLGVG